jgi:3'-phosphoadenosine 5'-phosphosulfate sulfotransferase (PAPS reductase)/FAD synthetase
MMALAFSGGKDSLACFYLMRDQLECAIYVDTGFAYPETKRLVDMVGRVLPMHIVKSDRKGQNQINGVPSDVVPIHWTVMGQMVAGPKQVTIQSYLQCCWENISAPLLDTAHKIGVTHLVCGQRNDEPQKSISRSGDVVQGMVRVQPIEEWSRKQVLDYLETKMKVPEHFYLTHSSLDCYDCTAFERESLDRLKWTIEKHPEFYMAYAERRLAIDQALKESLCPAT